MGYVASNGFMMWTPKLGYTCFVNAVLQATLLDLHDGSFKFVTIIVLLWVTKNFSNL